MVELVSTEAYGMGSDVGKIRSDTENTHKGQSQSRHRGLSCYTIPHKLGAYYAIESNPVVLNQVICVYVLCLVSIFTSKSAKPVVVILDSSLGRL
jgi:hypothetical protein